MLCPSRYDHQVSGLDVLIFAINGCLADARSEGQSLIDSMDLQDKLSVSTLDQDLLRPAKLLDCNDCSILEAIQTGLGVLMSRLHDTHLIPNVATHRYRHQDDLTIQPSPQYPPKLPRLRRQTRSHVGEILHFMLGRSGRHLGIFPSEWSCL